MKEQWKNIEGHPNYQISDQGNVKRKSYEVERDGKVYRYPDRILSTHISKGYAYVNFDNKTWPVHRLVGKAFLDNPDDLYCLIHKDEDKTNNVVDNLMWSPRTYHNKCKPPTYTGISVRCVETSVIYRSIKEATKITGISYESISNSIYSNKSVKGLTFELVRGEV